MTQWRHCERNVRSVWCWDAWCSWSDVSIRVTASHQQVLQGWLGKYRLDNINNLLQQLTIKNFSFHKTVRPSYVQTYRFPHNLRARESIDWAISRQQMFLLPAMMRPTTEQSDLLWGHNRDSSRATKAFNSWALHNCVIQSKLIYCEINTTLWTLSLYLPSPVLYKLV